MARRRKSRLEIEILNEKCEELQAAVITRKKEIDKDCIEKASEKRLKKKDRRE